MGNSRGTGFVPSSPVGGGGRSCDQNPFAIYEIKQRRWLAHGGPRATPLVIVAVASVTIEQAQMEGDCDVVAVGLVGG